LDTGTHTRGKLHADGRDQGNVSISQGMSEIGNYSPEARKRHGSDVVSQPSERINSASSLISDFQLAEL
jgi:hypothetical protein